MRRDSLRTVILGGGKISEQHLGSLKAIPGVQVTGICDLSPAMARFAAERFGIDQWFTCHQQMLSSVAADVVHVLTPPATHERLVQDCLESGRHVIVEKPVALSNSAFHELWQLASSKNLQLIENHNYRFNEPICRLERDLAAGRLGTVEEVEVRMCLGIRNGGRYADINLPHPSHRLPAGVIHEFISHLCYLLLHFLPGDAVNPCSRVSPRRESQTDASWRNHGGGDLFKYDDLDATVITDCAHGRIRFSCRQWPDCFSVTVRGSAGMATAELFQPSYQLLVQRPYGQHLTPLANSMFQACQLGMSGVAGIWNKIRNRGAYVGLGRFLEQTYASLGSGGVMPVSFTQMDRTSRLIDLLLSPENQR